MNARPSRPTRLVAIGLNRRDAKSAKVGSLYQVDASRLPWPCASWSESERAPGTLIPRAAVEVEIARSTAATLTAIAYAGALPTADEDAAEEEPPDGWEWKRMVAKPAGKLATPGEADWGSCSGWSSCQTLRFCQASHSSSQNRCCASPLSPLFTTSNTIRCCGSRQAEIRQR